MYARQVHFLFVVWLCQSAAAADGDQKLVEEYLAGRGIAAGAVVRPITDEYVARTFPEFTFFGVIYRQYPVAVQCPQVEDVKCSNVFFVREGKIDFASSTANLKFLFATEMKAAPSEQEAIDAAGTWLRLSGELKQDLFYTFSAPEIHFAARGDSTNLRGKVKVEAGGDGQIEMVMTLGAAGSFLNVLEKHSIRAGIRPICQATKLLDRDPIVRRMAEQDILVMGRAAKPYLDEIRRKSPRQLQLAIDRIWQRILYEGR